VRAVLSPITVEKSIERGGRRARPRERQTDEEEDEERETNGCFDTHI